MMPAMTVPEPIDVVLASASPRRRRLFAWLGLAYRAIAVDVVEDLTSPLAADPPALAAALAADKALAARRQGEDGLVCAFDTVVELDGELLGKPLDVPDAWRMLRALSGCTHRVVTGVALLRPDAEEPRTFAVTTNVRMKPLTDRAIDAWMAMGEFMGCAGAYNIEGQVAEVNEDECYQNVAGLPLCHVFVELVSSSLASAAAGATSPVRACDAALERSCRLGPPLTRSAEGR